MTTTTRARRFTNTPTGEADAKKDRWVVTWWQRTTSGTLELASSSHDQPGYARVAYRNQAEGSDPGMWHWAWDGEREAWNVSNAIADVGQVEQANINRKGFCVVRAVLGHRGGKDARGLSLKSLDAELADDNPGRRSAPRAPLEPLVADDPARCVVCDYAMEYRLVAGHLTVPFRPMQEAIHVPQEQF